MWGIMNLLNWLVSYHYLLSWYGNCWTIPRTGLYRAEGHFIYSAVQNIAVTRCGMLVRLFVMARLVDILYFV